MLMINPRPEGQVVSIISDRRLWLTADNNTVVEDGDPAAAFLLCGKGSEIPVSEAKRLGLTLDEDGAVVTGEVSESVEDEEAPAKKKPAKKKSK